MSTKSKRERVTVAQALRYKNRLAAEISRATSDIQTYNTAIQTEEKPEVDVRRRIEDRYNSVKEMIDLKVQLQNVAKPIFPIILEMAELKAEAKLYNGLNCTHGKQKARFREESDSMYVAVIRTAEKDKRIKDIQKRIDEIQTEIDTFNHTNHVEILLSAAE